MIIKSPFLSVKTSPDAAEKCVVAQDKNGKFLFNLHIRQAENGTPFYLNVERYIGQELNFISDNEEFSFEEVSAVQESASYHFPQIHYTVPYGWLNDPNGLIYIDGTYHLFCQHNPLSTVWGNMHWHHSVSTDLINWKHLGDALFPDDMGTMFSGSAICDKNNVAGFGKNAIILFYTIAEYPEPSRSPRFSQGLAYSTDGIHFTKYKNNPVVPNIKNENRDPKVVFVEEMGCYVMALYLDGDEYCLLKSHNLLAWTQFQSIRIENEWECPDIYSLPDSFGNKKWIISGASDRYYVGTFTSEGFVPEQPVLRHYHEFDERYSYAAQSFSGLKNRVIRLTWQNINPDNGLFCGQMSIPMQMSLVKTSDGLNRLKSTVCEEIEKAVPIISITDRGEYTVSSPSFIADVTVRQSSRVDIDGFVFDISTENNTITHNGKSIPLYVDTNNGIRFIVDKLSIEVLADNGLIYASTKALCNCTDRIITVE